jgi:aryl-alcohol dehydrogenase-like predicted oxidoreductase
MQRRPFGPAHLTLPVLGQGTWNLESADRASAVASLRRGLDLGLTHIDTAEMYGHGAVESLLGGALAGRRDEVYLVSKVLPSNASRGRTIRACEQSLRRLQTDRLDLYLRHWPGSHALAATVAPLATRRREGGAGRQGRRSSCSRPPPEPGSRQNLSCRAIPSACCVTRG